MDLGAYAQIGDLEDLMKKNNIEVPRLRGLRLMESEEPLSDEEVNEIVNDRALYAAEQCCRQDFQMNANWAEFSWRTDRIAEKYIEFDRNERGFIDHLAPKAVKWWKLHGKKRKVVKYMMKREKKSTVKQFKMWNKYCGKKDVLYIHARLGSGNWSYFNCDEIIKNQPWFLDVCEDWDPTYVDIYAKITER